MNVLESVSFTCVTRGTPMLSLSWSFPISDDRVNIRTNRNGTQLTSILTIGSTLLSDTGVYICNASNQQFSGYVSYNLTVGEYITAIMHVQLCKYCYSRLVTLF